MRSFTKSQSEIYFTVSHVILIKVVISTLKRVNSSVGYDSEHFHVREAQQV